MKTENNLYNKVSSLYEGGKQVLEKTSDKILLGLVTLETLASTASAQPATQTIQNQTYQQPQEAGIIGGLVFGAAAYAMFKMAKPMPRGPGRLLLYTGGTICGVLAFTETFGCHCR